MAKYRWKNYRKSRPDEKRLENLGEVNPTAIEAFTEMKKRLTLQEQKTDLVNAMTVF
jgi:chromosome segregation ATPase